MRLSVTRTARICPIEIAANISPCTTGNLFCGGHFSPNGSVLTTSSESWCQNQLADQLPPDWPNIYVDRDQQIRSNTGTRLNCDSPDESWNGNN